ncbi:hypothetical protein CWR43_28600 [Rhizobium sullae]|uniref:Uncharacterized protein n=1 Tax=Rhizobium sullae TaxID=50338 RepID=A0A2N0D3K9_RHISU|nr:hypothetical protein CWR43_28600 [Rhizobium sullae]
MANMRAQLLYRSKSVLSDGAIVEVVIWNVPRPLLGSQHNYKYSLFYGYPGKRVVGYGDHKHIRGHEETYEFSTIDKLIDDFLTDVEMRRQPRR